MRPPASSWPPPGASTGELLDAELQASLLRELMRTFRELNACLFDSALPLPVLRLVRSRGILGRWDPERKSIELSLPAILAARWGSVVEVLKHEMAHLYVDEVLRVTDESAHGPAFRQVCQRVGIEPAARGLPADRSETHDERPRILERVTKLLALAESPNLNEAKSAAALAQRLMLKHNIGLTDQPERKAYRFRHLGRPSGRVPESDHILAAILAEHFFVEAIWVPAYRPEDGKRGSVLEICGREENVEMAAYAHAFLRGTAERLWTDHRRREGIRSNRDRRTFLSGVMEGFRERLRREQDRCRERGLVWVGDADLQRFYRTRHPHIRQVRVRGHSRNEARARGRAAGRQIVLRRPLRGQAPTPSDGRARLLLPGGSPKR